MGIVAAVPALGFILAALAAWGVHSCVAVVLLIISLASSGALPLDVAFISVLGANLGTAINPLLEAGARRPKARRLPMGNLGNRVVGIALTFSRSVRSPCGWAGRSPRARCRRLSSGFNLVFALLTLPLFEPAKSC